MNYDKIFNDSYERISLNLHEFFDVFYQHFINKSEEIKKLFAEADMNLQKEMLSASLTYMISFSATKQASDYLKNIAEIHRNKLKISPQMYETWMDSLIETLAILDKQFDQNVELAWRVVLGSGIEFMKHYSKNAT